MPKNRDLHNINRVDPDLKIILESSLFQQAALLTDPVHQNLSRLAQLFWLLLLFLFLNFFIPLTIFIGTHFHFCWVGILVLRRRRFCIVKSPILTSVQRSNAADDYLLCICQISLSSTKWCHHNFQTYSFNKGFLTWNILLHYLFGTFNEIVIIIIEWKSWIETFKQKISLTNLCTGRWKLGKKSHFICTFSQMLK